MAGKKILYILAEMEDFWSSRLPLALAVQAKGCDVHICAPQADKDQKLRQYGFSGHDLPLSRKRFSVTTALKNISAIKNVIEKVSPDIIHTITLKFSFLTGLAMRKQDNTKRIYTIAGLGYLFSDQNINAKLMLFMLGPFIKSALRHPSAIITFQNSDDMDILEAKGFIRRENSILIKGSGVDTARYTPANQPDADPPIILMPTRLVKTKGISVFIDMAKILKDRGIPARFQIAGGITDHNPLAITRQEMEKMVGDHVEWLGKVADMPALYKSATLIVYPSWYREGIPRVLLEAASMGKAIITTDHPGCREAVNNNENGILVPTRNAEETANAVEALLKDPSRRKAMEQNSRARAENEFDVRIIAQETLKVYGF